MNETELNEFLKKKKQMCESHVNCHGCLLRINNGTIHCAAKYGEVTQWQMYAVMAWKPPVDWSTVAPDTKVVVWHNDEGRKYRRYFAKYEGDKIYTYEYGATSWSHEPDLLVEWKHGELAEIDE